MIEDFWNIDANPFVRADLVGRIDLLKLRRESVETIYCSHVLEHVPRRKAQRVLHEWFRVLRPGGKLYVCVPDLEALCKIYLENLPEYDAADVRRARVDQSAAITYGGQENRFDFHFFGYSLPTLRALLLKVGFREVELFDRAKVAFCPFQDAGFAAVDGTPVSLNVVASR